MSPLHILRTLILSLVVFGLTIGAVLSGAPRDVLYADPGVLDALPPLEAAAYSR